MDESTLRATAAEMGIELTETRCWEMLFHLDAVLRATAEMNLTAITDREEAIVGHVLDSLSCVPEVLRSPEGGLVDIGSGAGFPGIPLAIATERATTLVESTRKKAAFLSAVAIGLDHDIHVAPSRAEEHAEDRPEGYSVAVARAVAALPALVELAAPLLMTGGRFIAMKGEPGSEEMERGDRAAVRVGLSPARSVQVTVPGLDAHRVLVVYEKLGAAVIDLPRRPGRAQKHPLA